VHQLFIDFKKAYESIRGEDLFNILVEFGIPVQIVGLIKMCVTERNSRVWGGQHLTDMFLVENGLKEGGVLSPLVFSFASKLCSILLGRCLAGWLAG